MSLRHHALHESQSAGEVSDTGKFDAKIYAKKEAKEEAKKSDAKHNADAILTSRYVPLRHKALRETQNYGLVGGEGSRTGGK